MNGWTAKDIQDQSGKVVVITGGNSGVGYESAVALADKGARVVMASRSMDKAERAHADLLKRVPGANVDLLRLDLGDLKSVHEFATAFNATYNRLDVLMNNAGVMIPPYGKTADGFETQFGTNHLGHFALTGLLLPKLLETSNSRIVNVSSSAYMRAHIDFDNLQAEKGYQAWAAYGQSKLANILFTLELQRKLDAACVDVISVASHPGYAATNLQSHASGVMGLVMPVLRPIMFQSAEMGATYQLYAATAPGVKGSEFYGPRFTGRGAVVKVEVNAQGKNTADAARLWQISEQLTGVRYEVLGERAFA
jgi:NAD(P)-dependent dehydrogenase (short-subunit alcohol dehydrogenase family)